MRAYEETQTCRSPINALLALSALGLVLPAASLTNYAGILWLLSAFFIGIPHGASDWMVFNQLFYPQSLSSKARFVFIYSSIAALYLCLWQFSPEAGVITFLLITVWHWGSGDSIPLRSNPSLWAFHSWARGCVIILAPITFHLEESLSFLHQFPGVQASDFNFLPGILVLRLTLLICAFICVSTWAFAIRNHVCSKRTAWHNVVELAAMLATFYFLPPILSVALYFLCIHGFKHMLYLQQELAFTETESSSSKSPLSKLHLASIGCTLPAILLMLICWRSYPGYFLTIEQSTASYLVLIAGLTLPHALLILYWDILEIRRSQKSR